MLSKSTLSQLPSQKGFPDFLSRASWLSSLILQDRVQTMCRGLWPVFDTSEQLLNVGLKGAQLDHNPGTISGYWSLEIFYFERFKVRVKSGFQVIFWPWEWFLRAFKSELKGISVHWSLIWQKKTKTNYFRITFSEMRWRIKFISSDSNFCLLLHLAHLVQALY